MTAARNFRYVMALLLSLGLTVMAGCATPVAQKDVVRLFPGSIAVVAAQFTPDSNFDVYAQGKGAAAGKMGAGGALVGAGEGAVAPLEMGPMSIALYPILAPFTILAGAAIGGTAGVVQGAHHGLSKEQSQALSRAIAGALASLKIQDTEAQRTLEAAKNRPGYRLSYITGMGPRAKDDRPDYHPLANQGYDSILELTVTNILISKKKGKPPRVALEMKLRARVIQTASMSVVGARDFEWKSRPQLLSDWTANEGKLLQQDFDEAYNGLANELVAIMLQ